MIQDTKDREIDWKKEVFFLTIILIAIYGYTSILSGEVVLFNIIKTYAINNTLTLLSFIVWLISMFSILSLIMSKVVNHHTKVTLALTILIQTMVFSLLIYIGIVYIKDVFLSNIPIAISLILTVINTRTIVDVTIYFSKKV